MFKYFACTLLVINLLLFNIACTRHANNDETYEPEESHIQNPNIVVNGNNPLWAEDICFGTYGAIDSIYNFGEGDLKNPNEKYEYLFTWSNYSIDIDRDLEIILVYRTSDKIKRIESFSIEGDEFISVFIHDFEINGNKEYFLTIITKRTNNNFLYDSFIYSKEKKSFIRLYKKYEFKKPINKEDFLLTFYNDYKNKKIKINDLNYGFTYIFFSGKEEIPKPKTINNADSNTINYYLGYTIDYDLWLNWYEEDLDLKYSKTHKTFSLKDLNLTDGREFNNYIQTIGFRLVESNDDKWIEICVPIKLSLCNKKFYYNYLDYIYTFALGGRDSVLSVFKYKAQLDHHVEREFIVVISKTDITNQYYTNMFYFDFAGSGCTYLDEVDLQTYEKELNQIKCYEDFLTIFPKIENQIREQY